uniref:Zinc finger protein 92 homolog n=1 Tax=Moschus moschiferus TaxID=68415 RepID=A0A8C6DZK7_MOSMO
KMAAMLTARPKVPVSFEDVAIYFTKAEWKLLNHRERKLYKQVMLENYDNLVSVGFSFSKPQLVIQLEQGEKPWVADVHRTKITTGMQLTISKEKKCPKELPGANLQVGNMGQVRQFIRQQCGKSFNRNSNLIKHQVIHSAEKPFKCGECGKLFRRNYSLLEHQRIHSGEKPYACGECGKTFTRGSNLIKHRIIHTGEKPYECGECGKCFGRNFTLIEHQRIHSGERPYSCDVCGKAFSRICNLTEHQRTHSSEKPFTCSQCPKAFKGISQLIHHQRVHSGEKPFVCKECGKAFRGHSGLTQHHQVHTGEKPYECSECGKTFSRRSNLFKHQIVHIEKRPYRCQECGKAFRHCSEFLQHWRTTHSRPQPCACGHCDECNQASKEKPQPDQQPRIHQNLLEGNNSREEPLGSGSSQLPPAALLPFISYPQPGSPHPLPSDSACKGWAGVSAPPPHLQCLKHPT